MMSSESRELLGIDPSDLRFPFELKKQISCSLHLTNRTDGYIAFKVKTTSPKKYCVRPNSGIVAPRSTFDVLVTMQAQREAPPDMHCRDKFLVQSAVVSRDTTPKDISGDMFTKESGNVVDEVRLKVVYAPPSQPASINEGSDQESLGSLSYQETTRELAEPETITSESEVSSHPTKLIKLCLTLILEGIQFMLKISLHVS
uniref:Uncharacterized protein n=2 Tax=Avena sativa TaxID=4498 RepID=A0ACD5YVC8_AVESA